MLGPNPGDRGCDCDCHSSPHIVHCVPCCDGQCPHCGYRSSRGRGEAHEKKCREKYEAYRAELLARVKQQLEENK